MPDLAFSELNFLNSRPHEAVGQGVSLAKDPKRRGSRKADHNKEVSRYFSRGQGVQDHNHQSTRLPSHDEQQVTSNHLIELPKTPFLGFGSSGHKSSSPNKRTREPATSHVPRSYDRGPRSPTKSTSYLSWSQTNPRTPSSGLRGQANNSNVHRSPLVDNRNPIAFSRPRLWTTPNSTRTRYEGEVSESRDVYHRSQSIQAAVSQGSQTGMNRKRISSDFVGGHPPISNIGQREVEHETGQKGDARAEKELQLGDVGQARSQPEQFAPRSADGHSSMARHRSENAPIDNIGSNPTLATMPDSHRTGDYADFLSEQCKGSLVNETGKDIKENDVQYSDPRVRREQESPPTGLVQVTNTRPAARQSHDSPPQYQNAHFESLRADLSSSHGTEQRPRQSISASSRFSSKQRSQASHATLASNLNPAAPQTLRADSRNAWNMYGHLYDHQREGHPTTRLDRDRLGVLGRIVPTPKTPRAQSQIYSGMYSTLGTNDVLEDRAHGSNERETEVIDDNFVAAVENPSNSLPSPGSTELNSLEDLDRATTNQMADPSSFNDRIFAPLRPDDSGSSVRSSFVNDIYRPMVSPASFSPDLGTQDRDPVLPWRTIQRRKPSLATDIVCDGLEGFWKPNKLY